MSKNNLTQEKVDQLRKSISDSFVIGSSEKILFHDFDLELKKIKPNLEGVFEAFRKNIISVNSIVQIPYRMAVDRALKLVYNNIFDKEHILALSESYIKKNIHELPVPSDEDVIKKCHEAAAKKYVEFSKTKEFHIQVQFHSVSFINSLVSEESFSGEFLSSSKELINQASLLTWCALEILSRDTFVSFLNNNPKNVAKLFNESLLRSKFDLKSISTEKLIDKDFDLSNSMGDLLIENFDFSNIEIIRSIYKCLFNSKALNDNLENYAVWQLFQRRNLIVHRGGIVDAKYNSKTEDEFTIGMKLFIKPEELNNYLTTVVNIAVILMKETTGTQVL